jgi:isopenicillin N synthase-like dioxygenase
MHLYTPPKPADSIPVVNLEGSFSPDRKERENVAWEIHKACRETGFFYVSGHRIDKELVERQFSWARRLFSLPLDEKLLLDMHNSPTAGGYEPIGGQVLDSQDETAPAAPPDLKESYYWNSNLPDDHPLVIAKTYGFGHNQWPAQWPEFRQQMIAYESAMWSFADRLMAMIALSLELAEDTFLPSHQTPAKAIRLVHYPPQAAAASFNQLGAGAHTDWGGITLLAQDDVGGLEVQNVAGEWIAARPIPDTFVINLGDLMARWTNGLYRSNMHRVKNTDTLRRDRYSIPFFYGPDPQTRIACLATCTSTDNPPRFQPCTATEHMREMFQRSYGYAPAA